MCVEKSSRVSGRTGAGSDCSSFNNPSFLDFPARTFSLLGAAEM